MGAIHSLHGSRSLENLSRRPSKVRSEGKKSASKFATLRKKFFRHRPSQKTRCYSKQIRELTQNWNTHQINALVEEYESLSALKDLSIQTSLARPRVNTFKKDLLSLYENQDFSDVVLEFKGVLFPCHRCILSSRSPYFRDLLAKYPGYDGQVHVDIRTEELSVEMFRIMLHYLYSGDVPSIDTALDNLDLLLKLGEEFGTPNVLELDMNHMLNSGEFSDMILVFTDDNMASQNKELVEAESCFEIPCHQAVLAARSPFFNSLLTKLGKKSDMGEPVRLVLDEKVIPRQYGRVLLQCMYLDCVDVSSVIRWASGSDDKSMEDPHKLLMIPEVAMEVYEIARFLDFAMLEQGIDT